MSLQRYKLNPFLKDMIVPLKGKEIKISVLGKEDNILVNQKTGEIHGTHIIARKKVDSDQFVKIFTNNIAMTFNLSSPGIKAFSVLLWAVQNKALLKDEVDLDSFALQEFIDEHSKGVLRLSLATFKRGLNELENSQIIAKTMRKGRYFINPNFIFNGDRIAFTNIIEKLPEDKNTVLSEI